MRGIAQDTPCRGGVPAVSAESVCTCPGCYTRGVNVRLRTVNALLTHDALARICVGTHWLCESPVCPVVYYDDQGRRYDRRDVRVGVCHKEPLGSRTICYCFGETERTLRMEFEEHSRSDAVRRVRAHIEARRCACDIHNPRGVCCLEDLAAAVERAAAALQPKGHP
jgi:hypothetical protein